MCCFPALVVGSCLVLQTAPELREVDRVRIAEALRLAGDLGEQVWPGWDQAPFAILLIDGEREFLIGHPRPSDDFESAGIDPVLGEEVLFRERTHAPGLLATFPAVGGVSTVVVGRAEATQAGSSTPWVVTLLHEHFHQLQNSQPDYYRKTLELGLSGGDTTGGWMLNYDFPYDREEVVSAFAAMCAQLGEVLDAEGPDELEVQLAAYLEAKAGFRALLEPDDYSYFAFQSWQEGVARYAELRVAELAAGEYEPGAAFLALDDYASFEDRARVLLEGIRRDLGAARLDLQQRGALYAVGAAEGLVLDRVRPDWKQRYFERPFSLDHLLSAP